MLLFIIGLNDIFIFLAQYELSC